MPDVQEVFRMATQKVGPEPGALDRQLTRQRRSGGARKMGAFAVAASFIALAVAVFALTRTSSADSTQVASQPPAVPVPTTPGLYTVNVATGSLQSFPDPGGTGFTTSPDGSKIAFWSDPDGSQQLFVMNADGSDVQQVTDDPYGAESAGVVARRHAARLPRLRERGPAEHLRARPGERRVDAGDGSAV